MRKIFQQIVTQVGRPSVSAISKRFNLIQRPQQKFIFSSSLIFIAQCGFTTASLNDFYEVEVAADLQNGESREVQVGPLKDDCVLLCKVDDQYYCVSNKCSHFGAPLSQGLLVGDKVKCPWHNAAFSVKDGCMEEGPMLDGIETFPVVLVGGKVKITVKKDLLNKNRSLTMSTKGTDPSHYVIVGGGPAGQSAAETLRQGGFEGSITILTAEEFLPYDRTGLSKAIFQAGPNGSTLRKQEFFDKYGITVQRGSRVEGINYGNQELTLKGGEKVKYDKLLLATGGSARKPTISGSDLKNVFTFRTVTDVHQIKEVAATAKNIVIIGSSFIGLESAASLKAELKDKVNITVVGPNKVAFQDSLGPIVGKAIQDLHVSKGINFLIGQDIKSINGVGSVSQVELADGTKLEADLVIYSAGIQPNTHYVGDMKLNVNNGGIETDVFLRTDKENVWAAGDIASFPYWLSGEQVRVEHHNEAVYHGFVAGVNMLNCPPTPVAQVPFFWTRHYDQTLHYSGHGAKYDDIIVDGDLTKLKFIAYYARNGRVVASASMGVPNGQMIISEALRLNIMPSLEDLRSHKSNLETIKQSLAAQAGKCKCNRSKIQLPNFEVGKV